MNGERLTAREIFVFGSNLAGRHGKGSALEAVRNWGAIRGQGEGIQGNSYAIPTKDESLRVLPLASIERYVREFLYFAWNTQDTLVFKVVAIGCGLAGYTPAQIAPMFESAPSNVLLPPEFQAVLASRKDHGHAR